MLFSTKAEYGVRLMVELGRQADRGPVSLTSIAEVENLPLPYLEHLVANLRMAGLVTSTRRAHAGYALARPASEIDMLEVVEALEGPIVPMECFHEDPKGRVQCSHRGESDGNCATKFLWMKVHSGVTTALGGTNLADLVEFSRTNSKKAGRPRTASPA